jgi:hypothetical protein
MTFMVFDNYIRNKINSSSEQKMSHENVFKLSPRRVQYDNQQNSSVKVNTFLFPNQVNSKSSIIRKPFKHYIKAQAHLVSNY